VMRNRWVVPIFFLRRLFDLVELDVEFFEQG